MFPDENNKKLIIVHDKRSEEYANYLNQLISQNDDVDDKVVGCKDGTVTSTVWNEEQYKANKPKLTSNSYVLFIGDNKFINTETKNMNVYFNQYGMRYGWLGKRATMYVSKDILKEKDYNEFMEFFQKYNENFEKVKLNLIKTAPLAVKWGGVLIPRVYPVAIYGLIFGNKAIRKIREQQYVCLTLKFYLEALEKFLEE